MDIDYNALSLDQLKEINKKSAAAISSYENRQRKEAVSKATEIAKAAGFSSLEEMMASQPAKAAKAKPKYRHPDNPEMTWSGRGRKPSWIVEALDAGKTLDDFAI
jgi:DNA-binding protein H-NS